MLAAMGIGAVSATPTASFTKADANRFAAVVTDNDPAELLQGAPAAVNPAVVAGAPAEARTGAPAPAATPAVEGQAPRPPSAIPPTTAAPVVAAPSPSMEPWVSDRGQLASCSEEAFKADVAAFLKARTSKQVDPSTFPDAMLNGSQLDVFALYKEVCARGGYANGNVIDWKEEVFPKMRNYAAGSKVQGVGNALKRHYQQLLLEYEHANSGDVSAGVLGALDNGAAPMET